MRVLRETAGAVREAFGAHRQIKTKVKDNAYGRLEQVLEHSRTHVDPTLQKNKQFAWGDALHNLVMQTLFLPSEHIQEMFDRHHAEITEKLNEGKTVKGLKANATIEDIKHLAATKALGQAQRGQKGILDNLVNRGFLLQSGLGILGDLWGLFTNPDKAAGIASLIADSTQFSLNFIPNLPAAATVGINLFVGQLDGIIYNLLGGNRQQQAMMMQVPNGINGLTYAAGGG